MRFMPKRRWFRFSLRTLLALTAVVAVVLGDQLHWMRQRRAFLGRDDVLGCVIDDERRAPALLGLFGERGAECIFVDNEALDGPAQRLFPEARIRCMPLIIPVYGIPSDLFPSTGGASSACESCW